MNLIEDLACGYERWQSHSSRRSIALLARLTDVHYQTIRRIVQREVGETRFETAMAIASVIFEGEELLAFAKLHFDTAGHWLERWSNLAREPDHRDVPSYLFQTPYRKLMLLTDQADGISRSKILHKMGQEGIQRLDDLIETGIIEEEHGICYLSSPYRQLNHVGSPLEHIQTLLHLLDEHHPESSYRQLPFFTHGGLNDEGIHLLQKTLLRMQEEILSIHNNPEYRGNIPSVFLSLQGTLQ